MLDKVEFAPATDSVSIYVSVAAAAVVSLDYLDYLDYLPHRLLSTVACPASCLLVLGRGRRSAHLE